jgi:hypothetical protein
MPASTIETVCPAFIPFYAAFDDKQKTPALQSADHVAEAGVAVNGVKHAQLTCIKV